MNSKERSALLDKTSEKPVDTLGYKGYDGKISKEQAEAKRDNGNPHPKNVFGGDPK